MSAAKSRLEGAIALHGEGVTVAGVGAEALVAVLSPERADAYLTAAKIGAAVGSVVALYLDVATAVAVGNAVARAGAAYTVQAVLPLIHSGATVGRLAVCA